MLVPILAVAVPVFTLFVPLRAAVFHTTDRPFFETRIHESRLYKLQPFVSMAHISRCSSLRSSVEIGRRTRQTPANSSKRCTSSAPIAVPVELKITKEPPYPCRYFTGSSQLLADLVQDDCIHRSKLVAVDVKVALPLAPNCFSTFTEFTNRKEGNCRNIIAILFRLS